MIPNHIVIEAISRVKGVLSCKQLNWCDFVAETVEEKAFITISPNLVASYPHKKGERDMMKPIIERIFRNIKAIPPNAEKEK